MILGLVLDPKFWAEVFQTSTETGGLNLESSAFEACGPFTELWCFLVSSSVSVH